MKTHRFYARVERVRDDCSVAAGEQSLALYDVATIGRGADADFRLNDETVSAAHLSVERRRDGFQVTSTSERGSTFVNGEPLAQGESVRVDGESAWVQLGRLLLQIFVDPVTRPVDGPMTLPPEPGAQPLVPLLTLRAFGGRCEVWCKGRAASLFPSAARVLLRLARAPGEVVTHGDLLDAADPELRAGGASIAQLVTYVRSFLDEALTEGWLDEDELRAAVTPGAEVAADLDRRALLRVVVENVRGVGYRLRLPPDELRLRS